jgi:hypothetical protein
MEGKVVTIAPSPLAADLELESLPFRADEVDFPIALFSLEELLGGLVPFLSLLGCKMNTGIEGTELVLRGLNGDDTAVDGITKIDPPPD